MEGTTGHTQRKCTRASRWRELACIAQMAPAEPMTVVGVRTTHLYKRARQAINDGVMLRVRKYQGNKQA